MFDTQVEFNRITKSTVVLGVLAGLLLLVLHALPARAVERTLIWVANTGSQGPEDTPFGTLLGTTDVSSPPIWDIVGPNAAYANWYNTTAHAWASALPDADDTLVFAYSIATGNPRTNRDWTVKAVHFDYDPNIVTLDSHPPGGAYSRLTLTGDTPIDFIKIGTKATLNFDVKLDAASALINVAGANRYSHNDVSGNQLVIDGDFAAHSVTVDADELFSTSPPSVAFNGANFVTDGDLFVHGGHVSINGSNAASAQNLLLQNTNLALGGTLNVNQLRTTSTNSNAGVSSNGRGALQLRADTNGLSYIVSAGTLSIGVPLTAGRLAVAGDNVRFEGSPGAIINNNIVDMTISDGNLLFNRKPGSSLIGASLTVHSGASISTAQSEQFGNAAPISLQGNSSWAIGGTGVVETIGALSLGEGAQITRFGSLPRGSIQVPQMPTIAGSATIDANLDIGNNPFTFSPAAGQTITLNGILSGTSLNKSGPGALVIGPDAATFMTNLIFTGGTLDIQAPGFLNSAMNVSLAGGTTLKLNDTAQSLSSLAMAGATLSATSQSTRGSLTLSNTTIDFTGANFLDVDLAGGGLYEFNIQNIGPPIGGIPSSLTYGGRIRGPGLVKTGSGSLTLANATIDGILAAHQGQLVLNGTTSIGKFDIASSDFITVQPGVYDFGWLSTQKSLTLDQPTKLGRVTPVAGKTVTLSSIDLRNSAVVLDGPGNLNITASYGIASLAASSGKLAASGVAVDGGLAISGGTAEVSDSYFAGGLQLSAGNASLNNVTVSGLTLGSNGTLNLAGPLKIQPSATGPSIGSTTIDGLVTGNGGLFALQQSLKIGPHFSGSINSLSLTGGQLEYDPTPAPGHVNTLKLVGSSLRATTADIRGGLSALGGSQVQVAEAHISGGLTVDGGSTAQLVGDIVGSSSVKGASTLAYPFYANAQTRFANDVTFESGSTIQLGLHPQMFSTRFDFNGPVLIGQPQNYLYLLTGMDGKLKIDLSATPTDGLMGGRDYNLMDFTNAGYRSLFAINTIYPTLDNFELVQPTGAGGRLVMKDYVLSYVIGLAGDFNRDGAVDTADYTFWREYVGTYFTNQDYDVWRANFGHTIGTGASSDTAVPEPARVSFLLITAAISISGRSRRGNSLAAI